MQKNNPYGFTGQRFEPELRIYSFAYRIYNPMSMKWITVDPVRDRTNWYQYCLSDPVNLWDPLGLCGVDPASWRNVMKNQQPMMRGSDVEELQDSLNELGYDISVDGYYGNETADAVKGYQTSKGLGVDGVVGPNTRDEIMKDLGIEVEITEEELAIETDYLAKTIYGEARGENYESKLAVGWVIRNRVESKYYPDTYEEVITQRKQFSCWDDHNYNAMQNATGKSWEDSKKAAEVVVSSDSSENPLSGITHYYSPNAMNPPGSRPNWSNPDREITLENVEGFVFVK